MSLNIRHALPTDTPALSALIKASVRGLQANDYTPSQLEGALESVYGVDSRLIADRTYFAVEKSATSTAFTNLELGAPRLIVGCGGWSKRRTLYGGDQYAAREDDLLDPSVEAAKIRAFFVHPDWARRGIGSMILNACEAAAVADGFTSLEMGATLTGVPFYSAKGYIALEQLYVPLANGESLSIVKMEKELSDGIWPDSNL